MKYIESIKLTGAIADGYLKELPAVRWLEREKELTLRATVTFFAGENGAGKSTLMEAIAVAAGFNAEGGSRNFSFSTRETHSGLHESLTLSRGIYRPKDGYFLRAESLYNVATHIEELDELPCGAPITPAYGGSLHLRSHGESFLAAVGERFRGRGLYLLDEPDSALSPVGVLTMMGHIARLEREDSQFIIATHSPILLAYPGAEILWFSERGIAPTEYRQTSHYQLTKRILDRPDGVFDLLFGDERNTKV
ncbi:MAG: AAA family ATPase [Bacteroides sp.]|nr:AAA family ATPase [Eubacterium sp.]MCM1417754.1 AAA family ATPase [Roseburia sp.]MCM1461355.1 AAA family ATPase [Bacteroides sp.]